MHKPSGRNFKRNKIYAPEIDSLSEANLAFVEDVAKENDGVDYLLIVIDVFSKFLWVRPMKKKSARSLMQASDFILYKVRKENLKNLEQLSGLNLLANRFSSILRSKEFSSILQRTNLRPLW